MFGIKAARIASPILVTLLVSALVGSLFIFSGSSINVTAADECQMFNETGFAVCGKFLTYWKSNGGLTQQGFPISGVMDEQNQPPPAGDGKIHKVQYFQRARFEEHLENQPPYDVLLGLLGAEQLQAKKNPVITPPPGTTAPPTQAPPTSAPPTQNPNSAGLVFRSKSYADVIGSEKPKNGYHFLVLDVVLTNTTSDKISTCRSRFSVKTDVLYSYTGAFATYYLPKGFQCDDVAPGSSVAGQLAFEVPPSETPKSLTYDTYKGLLYTIDIP